MTTVTQLHYSPLPRRYQVLSSRSSSGDIPATISFPSTLSSSSQSFSLCLSKKKVSYQERFEFACGGGGGSSGVGAGSGGGDNGGWDPDWNAGEPDKSSSDSFGILGLFLSGWRSRVVADPQFPFKVLMEELVGVSACVLGDMASRPNFGLNELDFVFSTLIVGSILNFVLMYLLAPTAATSAANVPAIFASCPQSHMFETGAYSILQRLGTFIYKGTVFAAVGFAAGLVGTAISNSLIKIRKKMDPNFETPNKPPPTLLNALTWALHMGLSSNFRYQTLNGIEFLLAKGLPPAVFKTSVVVLRCLNNVIGGVSFVVLARLTGSQAVEEGKTVALEAQSATVKEKLLDEDED
ncbi:Protein RETICULATA-related [Dillenia turbinata]|uniref:Protein RETICULATA-related n=1 Tax=Dillenia turbinata TaxID=194707 RepID=A0AAN8YVV8_9MAGN